MKQTFLLLLSMIFTQCVFGQLDTPRDLTPQVLAKIKTEVDAEALKFTEKIAKEELTANEITFSVDTFKIQQTSLRRMKIDYSTAGMNNSVAVMSASYDKLLNQYYNKLLKVLKPADKNALIAAQRAWINYRDAESRLIVTMRKQEYSGGGTIQSNIAAAAHAKLVVNRTIEVFEYYNGAVDRTKL